MNLETRIQQHFAESLKAKRDTLVNCVPALTAGGRLMAERLRAGSKILSCGNGGSAGDAQHLSSELLNRFERERPSLAGIALSTDTGTLTSIANDYSYDEVFAKQVCALGRPGDILVGITTSGNSPNVLRAVEAAHKLDMTVIALTGRDGGKLAPMLRGHDIELRAAHTVTARIQEVHLVFIHCLCDLIDEILYPAA
ncbi:MAG: phosphoheptose isomerase [Nevskiales bacterium]